MSRYMDECRTFLPLVKPGWRWEEGMRMYCLRWEQGDCELTPIERTRRVIETSIDLKMAD